jgi:hypothetical protein
MAVIDLNLAALLLRLCSNEEERSSNNEHPLSSRSEAERMVWQAERKDKRGRLARDWHQLLALYGSFMAFYRSFLAFYRSFMALYGFHGSYGSLWLLQLEEAKNQIPQKPAGLDPPGKGPARPESKINIYHYW